MTYQLCSVVKHKIINLRPYLDLEKRETLCLILRPKY